jgi:peroxiredoxin
MPAITSKRPAFTRRALAALAVTVLAGRLALAGPEVGQPAPALVARQFDGQIIDLGALHGHVVVLNFWASWCTPCRAEMPALDALAREFQARGVTVIGLSVDDHHDRRDALKAAKALSYSLGMLSEAQRNDFGAPRSLPLTYVIGADGVIRTVLSANRGTVSAATLRAAVIALLPP